MRTRSIFIGIGILLLLAVNLTASSYFTMNSFGDPSSHTGIYGMGAGNTGLGLTDPHNTHPLNFSQAGILETTHISVGMTGNYLNISDSYSSGLHINYFFPDFRFVIPLKKYLKLGLQYQNHFQSQFSTKFKDQQVPGDTTTYQSSLTKSGGLEGGSVFMAFNLKNRIMVGLSGEWYFGHNEINVDYDYNNGYYTDGYTIYNTTYKGMSWSVSQTALISKTLSAAFYFSPSFKLTLDNSLETTVDDQLDPTSIDVTMGNRFGAGVSWMAAPRIRFNFDGHFQEKTKNYPGLKSEDYYLIGIGAERMRSRDFLAGFWERTSFRAGVFYQQTGIRYDGRESLHEFCITMGSTFPMKSDNHALLVALQIGKRGNKEKMDISETLIRFSIGLSGLEKWGTRRGYY
ncbi:MAG: hypothetical protein KBA26_07670 [Candidatus Delongbacteria bacterium]|nr:hypothetical protein [Candidatus Delongbacteria bacterium]